MAAGFASVGEATELFGDPLVRQQVQQWHHEGVSLQGMVERLGLTDIMRRDGVLDVLDNLTNDEVTVIRAAFLDDIARAGTATTTSMPVNCSVYQPEAGVVISQATDEDGHPTVRVEQLHATVTS